MYIVLTFKIFISSICHNFKFRYDMTSAILLQSLRSCLTMVMLRRDKQVKLEQAAQASCLLCLDLR